MFFCIILTQDGGQTVKCNGNNLIKTLFTICIVKLRAHGFPEKIISIYQDFLSDRKAVVQVGDTYSETFNLEVGCVQGSPSIWATSVQPTGK